MSRCSTGASWAKAVDPAASDRAGLELLPAGAAEAAVGFSILFWMLICFGMRIPIIYGAGYPLGALMTLFIALRSTWRGSRRVEWRGRVYREAGKRVGG